MCVGGTFRRCNQNPVNTFGKQRVSSQTVGESKLALESYVVEQGKQVREIIWMSLDETPLLNTLPSETDCNDSEGSS